MIRNIANINCLSSGTKPLDNIINELSRNSILPPLIVKHCKVVKEFGNLAAHGDNISMSNSSQCDLSEYEAQLCVDSITVIARWYFDSIVPNLSQENPYCAITGKDIQLDMIDQTIEIDNLIYPEKYRGMKDVCYAWFEKNPHIYTLIQDKQTERVVGYINAIPLEKEYYQRLEKGATIDLEIPANEIRRYDLPDFYFLYFASIGIHPSYQSTSTFRALYDAFIETLIKFTHQDIFISEIMADAVTEEGVRLCKYAGMKKVIDSNHKSTIYKVSLLPPSLRVTTKAGKNLTGFYSRKYEEFKDLF